MHLAGRALRVSGLVAGLIAGPVAAGCSGDDGASTTSEDGGGGDGGGLHDHLALVSTSALDDPSAGYVVVWVDFDAAGTAAGSPRPEATDDVLAWLVELSAGGDTPQPVAVALTAYLGETATDAAAVEDELGWSPLAVHRAVGIVGPSGVEVYTGDFDEAALTAAMGEPDSGVWAVGADDSAVSPADASPARRLGQSLRFALVDDHLVMARSTPPARDAVDGVTSSLADDAVLAPLVGALDDAGTYTAYLDVAGTGEEAATSIAGVSAMAVGMLTGPEAVVAFVFVDEAAAEAGRSEIDERFTSGQSARTGEPLRATFPSHTVERSGNLVVVRAEVDPDRVGAPLQMLLARDGPFA